MLLPEQLNLAFERSTTPVAASLWDASRFAERSGYKRDVDLERAVVGQALRLPNCRTATDAVALQLLARELLQKNGAGKIAHLVRVEWSSRLKSAAGRANYADKVISLNPRLAEHGAGEINRTLRHELAHFLAQFRMGHRRISPHGPEWREACRDLGIGDESRCHNLPFPISERIRRFLYRCPSCRRDFARARRIRRMIACLACCREHNGGEFDARFKLQLVTTL